jgi:hypothetical protein
VARLVERDDDDWEKPPPLVGQGRAIDPGDKDFGITGTWDMFGPNKGPKITGVYADPPFNSHGDPLKYPADRPQPSDSQSGAIRTVPKTYTDDGMFAPLAPVPTPVVTWGTPEMYQQPQPPVDSNIQPGDYPTPTPSPDDDKQTA